MVRDVTDKCGTNIDSCPADVVPEVEVPEVVPERSRGFALSWRRFKMGLRDVAGKAVSSCSMGESTLEALPCCQRELAEPCLRISIAHNSMGALRVNEATVSGTGPTQPKLAPAAVSPPVQDLTRGRMRMLTDMNWQRAPVTLKAAIELFY